MPQLIDHIDAIARQEGRDVLYVTFHHDLRERLDWATLAVRSDIISWLRANDIAWRECGPVASTTFFGSYLGQIYIDVHYDENDATYQKLRDFLEKPDGSSALPGVQFCYYPLDEAMKNAHHDVPGFWDKVWEDF